MFAVSFCPVPPVGNDRRPVQWESTEQKGSAPAALRPEGAGKVLAAWFDSFPSG